MNKRIKKISSYINNEDNVIDVGCDMALLGELLASRGIKSIASDINKNIVGKAKQRIKSIGLNKYISFYVSDGLNNIDLYKNIDTLVISGMGSYSIVNIIKNNTFNFKKIIIVSNNNYQFLRKEITSLNYKILLEEILYDKNKLYNLIIFIHGKENYTEKELLLGTNHINKELYELRNKQLLKKYKDIYSKHKSNKILNIIKLLEEC